jgi:transposase
MDPTVQRLRRVFASAQMRHLPAVEAAMGRQLQALLGQLDAACTAETELAAAIEDLFGSHPHARVLTSFPGVGTIVGARLLGEIGDDPTRFTDGRAPKRYAEAAPITNASGRTKTVRVRRVKNQRLAATGYVWAFAALRPSPGARRHYDARRRHGDTHTAALRHLWNRLLGCLHHCLQTHDTYQEHCAFPQTESHTTTAA